MNEVLVFSGRINSVYNDVGWTASHSESFEFDDIYRIGGGVKFETTFKLPNGGNQYSAFYIEIGSQNGNWLVVDNYYWNGSAYIDSVIEIQSLYINNSLLVDFQSISAFDISQEHKLVICFHRSGLVDISLNNNLIYTQQHEAIANESEVFNYFGMGINTTNFPGDVSLTGGYANYSVSEIIEPLNVWTDFVNCGERE